MSTQKSDKFVYLSNQFLEKVDEKAWRLALISYDKIALPFFDLNSFTTITDSEQDIVTLKRTGSWSNLGSFDDNINVLSLGFKMACEGNQELIDRFASYLVPISECGVPEVENAFKTLKPIGRLKPIPHLPILKLLETKLPANQYNNFPWANRLCLNDLLLGAILQQFGAGAIFVHRHDWAVMNLLTSENVSITTAKDFDAIPWVKNLPFSMAAELVNSLTSNVNIKLDTGINKLMKIAIPSFDKISIEELLLLKEKGRFNSLASLVEKMLDEHPNSELSNETIAEVIHDALWEAFDTLKPTKSKLCLAVAGAAPIGPINPFSLISLGHEIKFSYNNKIDALLVLNKLRRVSP